jgi:hypothetical protein
VKILLWLHLGPSYPATHFNITQQTGCSTQSFFFFVFNSFGAQWVFGMSQGLLALRVAYFMPNEVCGCLRVLLLSLTTTSSSLPPPPHLLLLLLLLQQALLLWLLTFTLSSSPLLLLSGNPKWDFYEPLWKIIVLLILHSSSEYQLRSKKHRPRCVI